jgi:hypothetical protein
VDASDGSQKWSVSSNNNAYGVSVSPDGSTVYYADRNRFTAVDASDGSQKWSVSSNNNALGVSVSPDGSTVYYADGSRFTAVDASDGSQKWSVSSNDNAEGVSVSPDGSGLYFAEGGFFTAFELNKAPIVDVSTNPSDYGLGDSVDLSISSSDSDGSVTEVCAEAIRTNTTTTQQLNQSCRSTSSSSVTENFNGFFDVSDRGYNYTVNVNATDDAGATTTDSKTRTIGNTAFTDAFDVLGDNVGAFNVTIDGQTKTNGSQFITSSSFNATFSKQGFFDKTASFTEGLDNEFTGVGDANVTVLVEDDPSGNTVNNYTSTISNSSNGFSENKSTTSGSLSFFAVQNTTYNVTADSDTRPFTSKIINITSQQQSVTFNLKKERSLTLSFRQASDESLIDQETVSFDLISDVYSANYTTNDGQLNITLLEPATYRSRFSAPGYPERKTVFTVVDESTNQQGLYLRQNATGEFIEVTVLDETGQPEPGLRVTSQQYFLDENEYKEQETSVTNTQGQVYQFLSFNDEYYQFTIRDSEGRLLKVTEPNYITSTTKEIQVQTATTDNTFYDKYQTISTTTSWNQTPPYTAITEYTNNARIGEICQTIRAETITGSYQATKKCADKATGALTQTWTPAQANSSGYPYSDHRYTARVTLVDDGQSYLLESQTLNQQEELVLGTVGLIVQVIITGAAAMTALVTPSAALLVAPVTLLVGGIIGLHTINIAITTLLTVSGGILAYMTQRRNA